MLLHLRSYSNLVNPKLHFFFPLSSLLASFSIFPNSLHQFFPPPLQPKCFLPLLFALSFPTLPLSLSLSCLWLHLLPLSPPVGFGRNSGFIIQPHLCQDGSDTAVEPPSHGTLCGERRKKKKHTAEGGRKSDTQEESTVSERASAQQHMAYSTIGVCTNVNQLKCVCVLQPHLASGASLWLWAFSGGMVDQTWHADARMPVLVSAASSKEP